MFFDGIILSVLPVKQYLIAFRTQILILAHPERHSRAVVSRALHLINIPIGIQQTQVHHAHVGTNTFHLLRIPQGERVIITVGENDGVGCAAVQVVFGKIAGRVTTASVVVIIILKGQNKRHRHGYQDGSGCGK